MQNAFPATVTDLAEINGLVAQFFRAFTNRGEVAPAVSSLRALFIPEAVIVKNSGPVPEVYGLEQFIAPRLALLTGGRLTDFAEEEYGSRTEVVGSIAQRLSWYRKAGVLDGQRFTTRGLKTFQFVRTPAGWRLVAVAWDDEREGFALPPPPAD